MKKNIFVFLCLLCTIYLSLFAQHTATVHFAIEVNNQWNRAKMDEPVVIRLNEISSSFQVRSAVVLDGKKEIPSQLDDLNGDLRADELAFVIDIAAQSKKMLTVILSSAKTNKTYRARVFAEMLINGAKGFTPIQSVTVPGSIDFYDKLLHHGPAFESELAGYRIYFDEKQTIDPYGKFHKGLEIEKSQFYPTDEQLACGFGNDVLMVGNSCGIGTLKGWNGSQATHIKPVAFRTECIRAYGPIRTIVDVEAKGWEYQGSDLTMTQRYILYAGHRDLRVETFFTEPLREEIFCTGVQNVMGDETLSYSDHEGLIGSWGRYWPTADTVKYAKETIGIATYIPPKYIRQEVNDKDNFLYTISAPGKNSFYHYTMFTSHKEIFGYSTPKAWFSYMQEWKEAIQHPVRLKIHLHMPK